jgi:hypothetical protein
VEGSVVADGGGGTHACVVDVAGCDVLVDELVVVSGSVVTVVDGSATVEGGVDVDVDVVVPVGGDPGSCSGNVGAVVAGAVG